MRAKVFCFLIAVVLFIGISSASFEIVNNGEGEQVIKQTEGENESIHNIPDDVDANVNDEGELILKNKGDENALLEMDGLTMNLEENSDLKYTKSEGEKSIQFSGEGSFRTSDKKMNNVRDAEFSLNANNNITFANFTSTESQEYVFSHGGEEFAFDAEEGSRVLFDPRSGVVSGENADLKWGNNSINSESFNLEINEEGSISGMEISNGFYEDLENGFRYSSDEDFTVYFNKDLSEVEGNAVSIFDDNGQIQAKGNINIEDGFVYEGLVDSAFFQRKLQGNDELIWVNANEDGEIARLAEKVQVGDLTQEEGFVSDQTARINTLISREDGNVSMNLDSDSLSLLSEIEKDPTKFALMDRSLNVELGEGESYFGISEDLGMAMYSGAGKTTEILNPEGVSRYLGNELDTVKNIVSNQAEQGEDLEVQSLGIDKVYDLQKRNRISLNSEGEPKNELEASTRSFAETKDFIRNAYNDSLVEDAALNSFMSQKLREIGYDEVGDFNEIDDYEEFRRRNLEELKNNLDSRELVNNSGDLDSLYTSLAKEYASKGSGQYKKSYERILESKVRYENLASNISEEGGQNNEELIGAYRGLMSLEDTTVSTSGEEVTLDRRSDRFSTRKLNLGKALARRYAMNGNSSDALAVMDDLEKDLNTYSRNLPEESNNQEVRSALSGLKQEIDMSRAAFAGNEFDKIQMDLYTNERAIENVLESRQGYTDRVSGEENLPSAGFSAVFSGGFGKDIVDVAGGFDDVKEAASNLEEENRAYSEGTFAIRRLTELGVSGETIEAWLEEEKSSSELTTELLARSGRAEKVDPSINLENQGTSSRREVAITTPSGTTETYSVNPENQEIVFEFLEDAKGEARTTYFDSVYSDDVKKLTGSEEVDFIDGRYESKGSLGTEKNLQKEILMNRVEDLEFTDTQEVLNFVDEGLSPATIALSAVGGAGGTSALSSSTGIRGAAVGIGESAVVNTGAGTTLVASGNDPDENPLLSSGAVMGTKFATGMAGGRILNTLTRSSTVKGALKSANPDDLRKAGLEEDSNGNIIGPNGEEIESIDELRNHMESVQSKNNALAKLGEAQTKIAQLNSQNFDSDFSNSCGECIKRKFRNEESLDLSSPEQFSNEINDDYEDYQTALGNYQNDPAHHPEPTLVNGAARNNFSGFILESPNGITIKDYIDENERVPEGMKDRMIRSIGIMHRGGKLHGNLNPENILINRDDETFRFTDPDYEVSNSLENEVPEPLRERDFEMLDNSLGETSIRQEEYEFPVGSEVYFYDEEKEDMNTGTVRYRFEEQGNENFLIRRSDGTSTIETIDELNHFG